MLTEGEEYKEVQLGPKKIEIPIRWGAKPLKEVSKEGKNTFIDGDWVESDDMVEDGEYQLIQLGNIGKGHFKGTCNRYIDHEFFQENDCTLVEEGDLLISRMTDPILRTIIVPDFKKKSITAVDVVVVKVDEEEWDKRYVKFLLNHKTWTDVGEAFASGSTRLRISRRNLEKILIPKPHLPEQKRIAEVLSTVDEAIQKTEEIIERAKELKKGLMQDLLTKGIGHEEFKEVQLGPRVINIPSEWKFLSLDNVAEVTSSKRVMKADYVEEGVPFYRSKEIIEKSKGGDISDPYYISEKHFLNLKNKNGAPEKGDILITSVGTLGVPYLVQDEEFYFKDGNLLWLKNMDSAINSRYIIQFLKGREFQLQILQMTYGSTQKALAVKNLKSMEIFLPPLPEQKKIAKILSTIDEKIQQEKDYRKKLEKLKKGLMQDLLTGKVRVLPLLSEEEKEELKEADVTG